MMRLWAIGFSVPVEELVLLQLDFPPSLLDLVLCLLAHNTATTTSSSSVLYSVLTCKNRFSVLLEGSLCDDPLNLGFDNVPVAPRCKRHCISAAGISPIVPES